MLNRIAYIVVCWVVFSVSITAQAETLDDGLSQLEQVSTFYQLFSEANLGDELADGRYTLFVPDNGAFDEIPDFVEAYLIKNPELLARIINYHLVETPADIATVFTQATLTTREGGVLTPNPDLNRINSADLIETDLRIGDHQVHIINRLLIPEIVLPAVDPFVNFDPINIAGSSTVRPITERMKNLFEREGFSGNIVLQETGTNLGFELFCINLQADIANASRSIRDAELENCLNNSLDPFFIYIAIDSLAVTVSQDNDFVDNLSLEELADVFSGRVNQWDEINPDWPSEPIQLFSPGSESGTLVYFTDQVLDGDVDALLNNPSAVFSEDDEELVRDVQNNPYAIGYFGYAYYIANQDTLRIINIDGIEPNEATAETGEYPLARPLFIFTASSILQDKPQVAEFVNYYITYSSAQIGVEDDQIGYFPVSEDIQNLNRIKWLASQG